LSTNSKSEWFLGGKKKSTHSRGEKVAKHNKKVLPFMRKGRFKGKKIVHPFP